MKDFKSKLAKFEKSFKTAKQRAKEEGGFGNDLDDGKYKARLESCELNEAQSSGRLQVAFAFVITAGELKGEKVRKYQSVETEDDQVWLARDFRRFGIEAPDSAKELEEIVELLDESKPELIISLKTKDSGQFCYIDKVTSEIDVGDFKAEDEKETGEEDPDEQPEGDDIEEGDRVSFKEDGEKFKGKVVEIDGDDVTVKDDDGDKHEVDIDKLSLVEKGTEKGHKKEEKGTKEDDSEVTIEIGMQVSFKGEDDETITGEIVKIMEDDNEVKVKDEDGEKHIVSVDDLSLPEKEKASKSRIKKSKR